MVTRTLENKELIAQNSYLKKKTYNNRRQIAKTLARVSIEKWFESTLWKVYSLNRNASLLHSDKFTEEITIKTTGRYLQCFSLSFNKQH